MKQLAEGARLSLFLPPTRTVWLGHGMAWHGIEMGSEPCRKRGAIEAAAVTAAIGLVAATTVAAAAAAAALLNQSPPFNTASWKPSCRGQSTKHYFPLLLLLLLLPFACHFHYY